jgi:hypothetical protein
MKMKTLLSTIVLAGIALLPMSAASITVSATNDDGSANCTATIPLTNNTDIASLTKLRLGFGGPRQQTKTPPANACEAIKLALQPSIDLVRTPTPAVAAAQAALAQAQAALKAAIAAQDDNK